MKRKFLFLIVLLIFILSFTGCKKTPSASPSPTAAATPTAVPEIVPTPTAVENTTEVTAEITPNPTKVPGSQAGEIHDGEYLFVVYDTDAQPIVDHTAYEISKHDVGFRFYATTDFDSIFLHCPCWENEGYAHNGSSYTVYIFKWDTDYETTESSKEFISYDVKDYGNNEWVEIKFTAPLEEGDYLFILSDPEVSPGIWISDMPMVENFVSFYNGNEINGTCAVRIHYLKTPQNMLGKLD